AHVEPGTIEALPRKPAVAEMRAAQVHAADAQAFELLRLAALADDQLGAAAADVDDERRPRSARRMVRYAEVDEPRFLDAGDHLDRMAAERVLGGREKGLRVPRPPQSARADDPHPVRLHVAEPLTEPLEARERARLAVGIEAAATVETRREPNHLAQPIEDREPLAVRAGDNDVETVRPEVDGRDDVADILVRSHRASGATRRTAASGLRPRTTSRSRRSWSRSDCG